MSKALLAPAAVLVLWSLLVMLWLGMARYRAAMKLPPEKMRELPRVGGRGQDLEKVLPPQTAWVSHNYTHLMEQPTLFYAVVVMLAILGQATPMNVALSWGYTGFRIAHSVWQITINTIPVRFGLFLLASACLIGLAISAVLATLA
jgi:hypothetical protein